MTIINTPALDAFGRKHSDARRPLARWEQVTSAATWNSVRDVRETFRSADAVPLPGTRRPATVFNIAGNKYRLITLIVYTNSTVRVVEVMTHAEYSKDAWKQRV